VSGSRVVSVTQTLGSSARASSSRQRASSRERSAQQRGQSRRLQRGRKDPSGVARRRWSGPRSHQPRGGVGDLCPSRTSSADSRGACSAAGRTHRGWRGGGGRGHVRTSRGAGWATFAHLGQGPRSGCSLSDRSLTLKVSVRRWSDGLADSECQRRCRRAWDGAPASASPRFARRPPGRRERRRCLGDAGEPERRGRSCRRAALAVACP
jgi:hypothetical protein